MKKLFEIDDLKIYQMLKMFLKRKKLCQRARVRVKGFADLLTCQSASRDPFCSSPYAPSTQLKGV